MSEVSAGSDLISKQRQLRTMADVVTIYPSFTLSRGGLTSSGFVGESEDGFEIDLEVPANLFGRVVEISGAPLPLDLVGSEFTTKVLTALDKALCKAATVFLDLRGIGFDHKTQYRHPLDGRRSEGLYALSRHLNCFYRTLNSVDLVELTSTGPMDLSLLDREMKRVFGWRWQHVLPLEGG